MQQNHTGNQVPFPTDRIVFQKIQLDPNALPTPPQFACPVPMVDRFGAMMLFALVTNIQDNAEQSSLRRLFFNRNAFNTYGNDFFNRLYKSAMAYLSAQAAAGAFGNINDLTQPVFDTAAAMCSVACAHQVDEWPHLMNDIPYQFQQVVRNDAMGYNEVSNMVNYHMQSGFQQNQQNAGAQYGGGIPNGGNRQYSAGQMFGGGQVPQPQQQQPMYNSGQQSGIDAYRAVNNVNPSASAVGSRFDQMEIPQPQQQQAPAPQYAAFDANIFNNIFDPATRKEQQQMEAATVETTDDGSVILSAANAKAAGYKWKPSEQQRYFPAYAPSKSELYFKINPQTGVVIATPRPMEYADHNVPNLAHILPEAFKDKAPVQTTLLDKTEIDEKLEAANQRIAADSKNHKAIKELSDAGSRLTTAHRDLDLVVFSEDAVWYSAALSRAVNKELPVLFRTYAFIREPIVGSDENVFVNEVGNQKTYQELKQKLIDGAANGVNSEVIASINRRMTRVVNDIIRMEMSITKLSIDSFVADLDELEGILRTTYGDVVANAFADGAYDVIDGCFKEITNNDNLSNIFEGYQGSDAPQLTFINRIVSVSLIDLLAVELDIELSTDYPSQLRASENPHLYRFVKDLFNDVRADGFTVESNLIRTKDGVVLKLTKGYFGNDSYQLTIISK